VKNMRIKMSILAMIVAILSSCHESILPVESPITSVEFSEVLQDGLWNDIDQELFISDDITSSEPVISFDMLSGTWLISDFLGTSYIHTDEEDEEDVVNKEIKIGKNDVYYGTEKIINGSEVNVS
jgi:hypothetical protein